uniref:Uncharacterized protein n=1 Tax=Steinernema glaseri TaxID=37863 RepID=A0A1I7ZF09_9BILA
MNWIEVLITDLNLNRQTRCRSMDKPAILFAVCRKPLDQSAKDKPTALPYPLVAGVMSFPAPCCACRRACKWVVRPPPRTRPPIGSDSDACRVFARQRSPYGRLLHECVLLSCFQRRLTST